MALENVRAITYRGVALLLQKGRGEVWTKFSPFDFSSLPGYEILLELRDAMQQEINVEVPHFDGKDQIRWSYGAKQYFRI